MARDYAQAGMRTREQCPDGGARCTTPRSVGSSARTPRPEWRAVGPEINSVTGLGLGGVSDTFATALWAPDALFELMRAGVPAVNLHARVFAVDDPFTFD